MNLFMYIRLDRDLTHFNHFKTEVSIDGGNYI